MYYLNSRYYNPELGRFINADTTDILQVQDDLYDKNLFSYCDNNPVMRDDHGGDLWQLAIAGGGVLKTGGFLAGLKVVASIVATINPVVLLAVAVTAVVVVGAVYYSKNKAKKGRPEQKKQGREALEKKKGNSGWEKRSGKKPRIQPRPHSPSKKGHRKYP